MAFVTKILVLAAVLATAYTECPCKDEKTMADLDEFRGFLLKLQENQDYNKFPVIPGELSPLLCNCIPKDRKKRKIVEVPSRPARYVHLPRKPAAKRRFSNRCAYGHTWIPVLGICVEM